MGGLGPSPGGSGLPYAAQALEEVVKKGIVRFEDALLRTQRPEDLEKALSGGRIRPQGAESAGKAR